MKLKEVIFEYGKDFYALPPKTIVFVSDEMKNFPFELYSINLEESGGIICKMKGLPITEHPDCIEISTTGFTLK